MEMTVCPAPPHLRGSVAALWELQGQLAGRSTGLPKPFSELVISLSGRHLWRAAESSASLTFADGWLTPVQAVPRFAETIGKTHLIGARLHPAAAARLFGPGAASGLGYPIPLDALLGSAAGRLRQSLIDAKGTAGRIARLATWLSHKLQDGETAWLPGVHELSRLGWRVDVLADELGLSPRGLHKRFVQELGIGPKLWLQLGRFDAVLRHDLARGSLADTAAIFGYSDQAHMTTEFRRFAGISPGGYIRSRVKAAAPGNAPHLVPESDEFRNLQETVRPAA